MKRFFALLLAAIMVLCLIPAASAESVQDALAAAATMTNEELYAKAKEEMAKGAQLRFYSTTSFAEKAAAKEAKRLAKERKRKRKALEDAAKQAQREAELLEEYRQKYREQKQKEAAKAADKK